MDVHQEIKSIEDITSASTNMDQADDNVILPIELTNTTGTYLQQLNTDCLREIFSSNLLTLMDLCSLAETSIRFKEITESIFPKDLSVANYDEEAVKYESNTYGTSYGSMQDVQRILKNFGPYVSRVSLYDSNELVEPVANYCGIATLERLKIRGLHESLTRKLKTVFQRMLALSIYKCNLMKIVTCPYINCDSLIELEITYSFGCAAILKNSFPNLERFTFYENSIFSEDSDNFSDILVNFIGRHKRLRTLDLSSESVYCSSELVHTINKNCMELTSLTLQEWNSPKTSFNFSNVKNLANLSMLSVNLKSIDYRQLIALLEVLKSLITVKLSNLEYAPFNSSIFNVLSQLKNLRQLHLTCGYFNRIPWAMLTQLKELYLLKSKGEFFASYLLNIIRELTNLEELEVNEYYPDEDDLYDIFELSSKDFSDIVKIVRRRPNMLTLRCRLSKNLIENYDKNKNVNLMECRIDSDEDYEEWYSVVLF